MGAGATPPGWYPDVERPGGERYWNGSAWTEDRRQPPTAAEPFAAPGAGGFAQPAAAPAGYAAYGAPVRQYPGNDLAGWGLGLSIFGFICCQIFCVAGAIMGYVHLQRIKRGERDPASRGLALAATIVGGIGSAILIALIIFYIIFGLAAASS